MKHAQILKSIAALLLCITLAGCIRQEIDITINSDGSGSYKIVKFLNTKI